MFTYIFTKLGTTPGKLHQKLLPTYPSLVTVSVTGDQVSITTSNELTTEQQTNIQNYLSTYVETLPHDQYGNPIVSAAFREIPYRAPAVFKSYLHTVVAGTTNIFDTHVTDIIFLTGGAYKVFNFANVQEGDYLEFSLIDKDNTLGLFSTYGLTVGVHVLELFKYVRTEYIDPTSGTEIDLRVSEGKQLIPGLYLRLKYVSLGTVNLKMRVRHYLYEA